MTRILIRAGKSPLTALSHEQSLSTSRLGVFGSNSGNMLFYSAVFRVLSVPGAEVVANSYVHERPVHLGTYINRTNEEFDRFVLPMANSYRDTFLPHLERLAKVIERLKIPVTVVGIGAQLPYGTEFDSLPDDYKKIVTRFTRAVLDRSASIGVRGEYTARLLKYLGFGDEHVRVIGCPSMFGNGPLGPLVRKVDRLAYDSPMAISYTPKVKGVDRLVEANTDRYPNSVIVPQQHHRLALMLWGENPAKVPNKRMPIHTDHPLYENDRMRFFVDASTWVEFMAEQHFAFGTRIHGNVAGVLAGTPSVVLAHDSRTVELSEYHGIPYRLYSELPPDVDAQRLYEEADFDAFGPRQAETFDTYVRFLEHNDLEHVFQPGKENPAYDKALAAAKFPGPVHTLMASDVVGRRQVMSRLRWLRQGHEGDLERRAYEFEPPFREPRGKKTLEERVTELEKELKVQQESLASWRGRMGRVLRINPLSNGGRR
ncbi:polysaccharide pyruvyl transferase family protein [Micromonospora sp. C95]|uniref:polysaccharide pyruvyl transferase family protein n=1 Tax=Micromonospora sp. C95 TaxID=2824882 RepID=UPI001B38F172|nr:polysaccharide pyruvyl transferase family protein [Micromonospora sp. C95]MBQ1026385.1 polysaccharide pyruvyl transferase family protein [Micromonospora sp. C95]